MKMSNLTGMRNARGLNALLLEPPHSASITTWAENRGLAANLPEHVSVRFSPTYDRYPELHSKRYPNTTISDLN
jgi:hypothetical protein